MFNSLGKTNTIDNYFGHIGIDFMVLKMKNGNIKRIVATRFSKAQLLKIEKQILENSSTVKIINFEDRKTIFD